MQVQEDVAIFWDYEHVNPLNTGISTAKAVQEICAAAHKFGPVKSFKAYVDLSRSESPNENVRSELQSHGISLVDCPSNINKNISCQMSVDMMAYAIDHPSFPTNLILVVGDCTYAYAVATLRLRRYHVAFICSSGPHAGLFGELSGNLDWNKDILGLEDDIERQASPPLPPPPAMSTTTSRTFSRYSHTDSVADRSSFFNQKMKEDPDEIEIQDTQIRRKSSTFSKTAYETERFGFFGSPLPSNKMLRPPNSTLDESQNPLQDVRPIRSDSAPPYMNPPRPSPPASTGYYHTPEGTPGTPRAAVDFKGKGKETQADNVKADELSNVPVSSFTLEGRDSFFPPPPSFDFFRSSNAPTMPVPRTTTFSIQSGSSVTGSSSGFSVVSAPQPSTAPTSGLSFSGSELKGEEVAKPPAPPTVSPNDLGTLLKQSPVPQPKPELIVAPVVEEYKKLTPPQVLKTMLPSSFMPSTPKQVPIAPKAPSPPQVFAKTVLPPSFVPSTSKQVPIAPKAPPPKASLPPSAPPPARIPVPIKFAVLVQSLQHFRRSGIDRPDRSIVATDIIKRNPKVYTSANLTTFKKYSALAEVQGIVTLGGGGRWIELNDEYV